MGLYAYILAVVCFVMMAFVVGGLAHALGVAGGFALFTSFVVFLWST